MHVHKVTNIVWTHFHAKLLGKYLFWFSLFLFVTDHPLPCDCGSAKCLLISALMQKYDEEQTALELEAEEMDACAATEAARNVDLVENSGTHSVNGSIDE